MLSEKTQGHVHLQARTAAGAAQGSRVQMDFPLEMEPGVCGVCSEGHARQRGEGLWCTGV